jgi:hypothetical protein
MIKRLEKNTKQTKLQNASIKAMELDIFHKINALPWTMPDWIILTTFG